jgi:hypothetical protein
MLNLLIEQYRQGPYGPGLDPSVFANFQRTSDAPVPESLPSSYSSQPDPEPEQAFVAPAPVYVPPAPPVEALPVTGELLIAAGRAITPIVMLVTPGTIGRSDAVPGQPMFDFSAYETETVKIESKRPPAKPPTRRPLAFDDILPPNWNDLLEWPNVRDIYAPTGVPIPQPDRRAAPRGPTRRYRPAPADRVGGVASPVGDAVPIPTLTVTGRRRTVAPISDFPFDLLSPALPDLEPTPFGLPAPSSAPEPRSAPDALAFPFPSLNPFADPLGFPAPDAMPGDQVVPFAPPAPAPGLPNAGPSLPNLDPLPFTPFVPEPTPQSQPRPDAAGNCNCVQVKPKKKKKKDSKDREVCKGGGYVQRGKGITYTPKFTVDCKTGERIGDLPKKEPKKKPITKTLAELAREIFQPQG